MSDFMDTSSWIVGGVPGDAGFTSEDQIRQRVAAIRANRGLDPDPASDDIWVRRVLSGQATIGDARTRITSKAFQTVGAEDPGPTQEEQDAVALVTQILRSYGLEELSGWAEGLIRGGATPARIEVELYEQPAFRKRFRAIFARQERGLPPISPEEVMAYERQRAQVMRMYGFPEGFYDDPDDAVEGLVNDVSINEVEQRAATWVDFARNRAPEVRLELQRLYGVTDGALAAYMMDPDRALPLIQRQANAALVGFAAQRNNFGFLTASEAERFGELGIGSEDAAQRFGVLGRLGEVLGERVGDQQQALSREGVLGAAYGDASATDEVERRQRRAAAEFEQGGGFAGSSSGLGGLGTAQ